MTSTNGDESFQSMDVDSATEEPDGSDDRLNLDVRKGARAREGDALQADLVMDDVHQLSLVMQCQVERAVHSLECLGTALIALGSEASASVLKAAGTPMGDSSIQNKVCDGKVVVDTSPPPAVVFAMDLHDDDDDDDECGNKKDNGSLKVGVSVADYDFDFCLGLSAEQGQVSPGELVDSSLADCQNPHYSSLENDLAETIDTVERDIGIIENGMNDGASVALIQKASTVTQAFAAMVQAQSISVSEDEKESRHKVRLEFWTADWLATYDNDIDEALFDDPHEVLPEIPAFPRFRDDSGDTDAEDEQFLRECQPKAGEFHGIADCPFVKIFRESKTSRAFLFHKESCAVNGEHLDADIDALHVAPDRWAEMEDDSNYDNYDLFLGKHHERVDEYPKDPGDSGTLENFGHLDRPPEVQHAHGDQGALSTETRKGRPPKAAPMRSASRSWPGFHEKRKIEERFCKAVETILRSKDALEELPKMLNGDEMRDAVLLSPSEQSSAWQRAAMRIWPSLSPEPLSEREGGAGVCLPE